MGKGKGRGERAKGEREREIGRIIWREREKGMEVKIEGREERGTKRKEMGDERNVGGKGVNG